MQVERVFLVVLDGVGAGELPDAALYGDAGSDTLRNTARAVGGMLLPTFERLGLGCLGGIAGVRPVEHPKASFGRMAEVSPGKDTTTGHWEIAGLQLAEAFPTYPKGFPADLIAQYETAIGRQVLGNEVASGTEIIARLGDEHVRTGRPIVYTSADSVFQVAAHEAVIPIDELYRMCETARVILTGDHAVGRVIARPFEGTTGRYVRTPRRKDFSLPPQGETILDRLSKNGWDVRGVGKIEDIFANRGLTWSNHTVNNATTLEALVRLAAEPFRGLVFANCIDFDMVYGHRNDVTGFAAALNGLDEGIARICERLTEHDVLIITADHGCDPTTPSTDHSREYVPLLAFRPGVSGIDLGTRSTFCDIAATIADLFQAGPWPRGTSFAATLEHQEAK